MMEKVSRPDGGYGTGGQCMAGQSRVVDAKRKDGL